MLINAKVLWFNIVRSKVKRDLKEEGKWEEERKTFKQKKIRAEVTVRRGEPHSKINISINNFILIIISV